MLLKLFGRDVPFNVCCPSCGFGSVDIEKEITINRYQLYCKTCKKSFILIKPGCVGQRINYGKSRKN